MPGSEELILGEFTRSLDERYRVSIPSELTDVLLSAGPDCMLAKERPGCLSLWSAANWQAKLDQGVALVQSKMQAGRLEGRVGDVQLLGRLLSTRHKAVQIAGRGRLLVPEGFRPFLGVEPGGDVMIVGAAVCIELWRPERWLDYIEQQMPDFRSLFDNLAG